MSTIVYGSDAKQAHKNFIDWLNIQINSPVSGFWSSAIDNLVVASFNANPRVFLQEMYEYEGQLARGFLVIMDLDEANKTLIYYDSGTNPVLYNNTDVEQVFDIESNGRLSRFYNGVQINLLNSAGSPTHRVSINLETWFGTTLASCYVKRTNGEVVAKGFLDTLFDGRRSGTYTLDIQRQDGIPQLIVTNIQNSPLTFDLPILANYSIPVYINPQESALVPKTDISVYNLEKMRKGGSIKVADYA
jgi:hypothetical protein